MNSLRHIVAIVCLLLFGIAKPAAAEDLPKGEDADVKEIVFGHIGDAYGWHITTWGETPDTVPLPVIVCPSLPAVLLPSALPVILPVMLPVTLPDAVVSWFSS